MTIPTYKTYLIILFAAFFAVFLFSCEEDLTDDPIALTEDSLSVFLETHDLSIEDVELEDDYSLNLNISYDDCTDDYPGSLVTHALMFSDTAGIRHIVSLFVPETAIINDTVLVEGTYTFADEEDDNYHKAYTIDVDSRLFYGSDVETEDDLEEIEDGVVKIETLASNESKITIAVTYGDGDVLAFAYSSGYTVTQTTCSE